MGFTIERGVEKPVSNRGRRGTDFPLTEMEVSDSFLIDLDPKDKKAVESWRRKVLVAKKRFAKEYEGKFETALVGNGLRVWRTA